MEVLADYRLSYLFYTALVTELILLGLFHLQDDHINKWQLRWLCDRTVPANWRKQVYSLGTAVRDWADQSMSCWLKNRSYLRWCWWIPFYHWRITVYWIWSSQRIDPASWYDDLTQWATLECRTTRKIGIITDKYSTTVSSMLIRWITRLWCVYTFTWSSQYPFA